MKHTLTILIIATLSTVIPRTATCQAEVSAIWYENEQSVPYPDNTAALAESTDNAVEILHSTSDERALALQGEIMLKVREDIAEVYSNGNLVEQIVKGVGSTGIVTSLQADSVRFIPTGRPELTCPPKDSGWFGPCRVEQGSEEG
jgi:hypothetical protein